MSKNDLKNRLILEELTKDSRIPLSKIARKLRCSPKTVKSRLDFLEKEYLLEYALSFNDEKLNLDFYMILVKLKGNYSEQEISDALKQSRIPQFAAITKGDFDLIIYACSQSGGEFDKWSLDLRRKLNKYIVNWLPIQVLAKRFGFFQLQSELISGLGMKKQQTEIIKILNKNSRTPIKEIAETFKVSSPTAKYHLDRIFKSGIVKKGTITFKSRDAHFFVFQSLKFPDNFEELNRNGRQFWINNLNNITCICRLSGTYDLCVLYSAKSIDQAYELQKENYDAWSGVSSETAGAIVLKVLLGEIAFNPYRRKEEYSPPDFLK